MGIGYSYKPYASLPDRVKLLNLLLSHLSSDLCTGSDQRTHWI